MKVVNKLGIYLVLGLGLSVALPALSQGKGEPSVKGNAEVVLQTTKGAIRLELLADQAPITVDNFLGYVESGFYDGTVFHRVIPGFMIQGGGFDQRMEPKATRAPIKNEADNGLENERGTLSMARTSSVDSATSQFFINVADNTFLDHGVRDFGYAVFARVLSGMDVVDTIVNVPSGRVGGHADVPTEPVLITGATVDRN